MLAAQTDSSGTTQLRIQQGISHSDVVLSKPPQTHKADHQCEDCHLAQKKLPHPVQCFPHFHAAVLLSGSNIFGMFAVVCIISERNNCQFFTKYLHISPPPLGNDRDCRRFLPLKAIVRNINYQTFKYIFLVWQETLLGVRCSLPLSVSSSESLNKILVISSQNL